MTLDGVRALLREAKRRRVYISAVAYVAVGGGIIQLIDPVADALLLPAWTSRLVTFLVILGFPVVLVFAWVFDVTSAGVIRTSPAGPETSDAGTSRASGAARILHPMGPIPKPPPGARRPSPTPAADVPESPPDPLRVKRAALAHMRHELRTPIGGILGYAEMVLEEVDAPSTVADLERIREAGGKLLALVDEILSPEALSGSEDRNLEGFGRRMRAGLRTPVNAIIGYTEIVMESVKEDGRTDLLPDLERLRSAARRLLDLGEDILALGGVGPAEVADRDGLLDESSKLAREVLARIRPVGGRSGTRRPEREGRVLVVDDNPMSRDLLSRGLARAGYLVTEAEDGASALALLERRTFDVVLLDVIMPGLNGVEVLQRLRDREHLSDTPVIMLSSLDEVDGVVRCIELGAEEYLTKPVLPPVLEARVAANVEFRRLRALAREYHARLEADERFIEDLLMRSAPPRFVQHVRTGALQVEESYAEVTAACCVFGRGPVPPSGVAWIYPRIEELMEGLGVEMSVWRPGRLQALAGAPGESPDHAARMSELALRISRLLQSGPEPVSFRLGLHTGPAASGILGEGRFRFELWGEAVELAERVAVQAPESGIVVTPAVRGALRDDYAFASMGIAEVDGGGRMRIYQLSGRVPESERSAPGSGVVLEPPGEQSLDLLQ